MSSASEDTFTHGSPSQEADTGKQERQNLPGGSRSNKSNGTGSSFESGSRKRRRDLGRAEWRYV